MDNAGGHGTQDATSSFPDAFKEFNAKIFGQTQRNLEVNMLDLGVWMIIQTAVMQVRLMHSCHHEVIAKSIFNA